MVAARGALSICVRHHGPTYVKTLLSLDQLRSFIPVLRDLFAHVERVLASLPPDLQFKRPQIPSALSESLAAHLLNSGRLGTRLSVTPSRSGGDLEFARAAGGPGKLEVKGTGPAAFQQFGAKDLAADVLVWLHFDNFFSTPSTKSITVHFLAKPAAVIAAPSKMQLPQFLELPGVHSTKVNLVEFLGLQRPNGLTTSGAGRDA